MSDKTAIEWTDSTWGPVTGCTKVSPGCDHCYAETIAERFRGAPGHYFEQGFDVQLRPDKLDQPLRWRKPRRIFVNSMSDLFHDDVPDDYVAQVFAVMALASQHTFQVLTKRHGRMRSLLNSLRFRIQVETLEYQMTCEGEHDHVDLRRARQHREAQRLPDGSIPTRWPLPNVWLGVSVENQQWAEIRIPALLDTPAAVRFLSCEPLLGPIDLHWCGGVDAIEQDWTGGPGGGTGAPHPFIDWVIVGGESGRNARPMHPDWARSLRDQCTTADIPFLFKQWGEWAPNYPAHLDRFSGAHDDETGMWRVGKHNAGRVLDAHIWNQYPERAA